METYNHILNTIKSKGAAYFVLLDPDKLSFEKSESFLKHCANAGVDGFLIGGSLMLSGNFEIMIEKVKANTNLPAIIFPGSTGKHRSDFLACRCNSFPLSC